MKAVRLQNYGDPSQFKLEEVADPVPAAGEILIRVAAAAVNHVDLSLRKGLFRQTMPLALPAILGRDVAGTVLAVGPDVTGFAIGDRVAAVLPVNGHGGYAELAAGPARATAKLADGLSFEQAAALGLVGLVGRKAVAAIDPKPGQRVLVSGALGGVGRIAVQFLAELGAKPVAGVLPFQMQEATELTREAIDLAQPVAGPTFAAAINTAAPALAAVIAHLRDGGIVASTVRVPPDANPDNRVRTVNVIAGEDQAILQSVMDAAARGEVRLPIAARFTLAEADKAHAMVAEGPSGKVLLLP